MSFNIIPTPQFSKELKVLAKKYPGIKGDIEALFQSLAENPQQGESLGMDCFKLRMPITGKTSGKSGGARVITCVKIVDEKVYLVSIFDKSDQSTLTKRFLKAYLDRIFPRKK